VFGKPLSFKVLTTSYEYIIYGAVVQLPFYRPGNRRY